MSWKPNLASILLLLLLVAAAGIFHGASWTFPGWWPGAWIGQALLVIVAVRYHPWTGFFAGLGIGCIGIGWAFAWAPTALIQCFDAPELASRVIYSVLVVWESMVFALTCGMTSFLFRRHVLGLAFAPIAWVVAEFWWPRIFPWLLGYSQLDLLPLLQIAEWTGSCGISFVVTAVATLPAVWLVYRSRQREDGDRRALRGYAVAVGTLLILVVAFGQWRIHSWQQRMAAAPDLRIGVVQVDPSLMGCEAKLKEASLRMQDDVDLICWPESAIGYYSHDLTDFTDLSRTLRNSRYAQQSLRPSEGIRCNVLAGGKTFQPGAPEEGPYAMTAFLIDSAERIVGRYRKRTLLPFGEYVPGQNRFPQLREWATLQEIFEPGDDATPLVTSRGERIGVVICYEDMIRSNVHETVAAGAEVLISLINGSAFNDPLTLEQHKRLAQLRAVEHRRYFVRCAGTGISCMIAPTGEILSHLGVGVEGTLQAPVHLIRETTVYTRFGEFFPYLCTLALAFGVARLGRARTTQRARRERTEQASTARFAPDDLEAGCRR